MRSQSKVSERLLQSSRQLCDGVEALKIGPPVSHVYNPLSYAWGPYATYLRKFGNSPKRIFFLGMNPGPFGMTQTGVPFGEISMVRDWLKIQSPVGVPARQHPLRPVTGFDCPRSEVSGRRLWGLFAQRFGSARNFFADHFVLSYCPLVFIESSGRNRTPDKLPAKERAPLFELCNTHLEAVVAALEPEWIIGIGGFAEGRARELFPDGPARIGRILHPSPASPAANRGWEAQVVRQMRELGLWA